MVEFASVSCASAGYLLRLPPGYLRQLVHEEDAGPLRLPDRLHDPGAAELLELLREHGIPPPAQFNVSRPCEIPTTCVYYE